METKKEDRILARIVARELTNDELEGAAGGWPFKETDLPGANNSSSVTTCSDKLGLNENHLDGGADD